MTPLPLSLTETLRQIMTHKDLADQTMKVGRRNQSTKDWCKQFFKVDGVADGKKVEVVKRFGVLYDDPIMEHKNLKQTGSVQTYQEAFKALLNRVDLPEPVANEEATNTILKSRYNTPLLPTPKQSTTTYVSKVVTTPFKPNSIGQSSGYVTKNGYAPFHNYSGQLHSIEVLCEGDFDNYIDGDDETYEDYVGDMVGVSDSPQITLNALSGLNSYQTMRDMGRVVANGQRMISTSVCHDLKWSLQNEVFTSDMMLLPLGGCEMVLRHSMWLATLRDKHV
ncbi:hypothetical protein Tco_0531709 [Tanacetum coccineum]